MELKEIKEIVAEILFNISKNSNHLSYQRYYNFMGKTLGMSNKRNFQVLRQFDKQFRKNEITLWCGKDQLERLEDLPKGETITFRTKHGIDKFKKNQNSTKIKVKIEHAGKIIVSNNERDYNLFEHQEKAIYALQNKIVKIDKNPFGGLLVLPTGSGKTLTTAYWLAQNYLNMNKKILWIAHRHELLNQAQKTFHDKVAFKDLMPNRTDFNFRIISGIHDKPINIQAGDDIIFASKDSINSGFDQLYKNWIKNKTDEIFLVVDEAHHATAKTYRKLINKLSENVNKFKMLGLTATPFRTAENEQGLLKKVFPDDIIYKIDLRSLIRLGILSEPIFEEVETHQNFVKDLTDKEIDNIKIFDINTIGEKIASSIAKNKERNHTIVNKYIANKQKYKQTLVFALNIDNAIALSALFKKKGVKSEYVISSVREAFTGITQNFTKENKAKIDQFRKGDIEVLINVNILTEGTDVPNVQSIFLARPTISSILMTQMIGRGLRGPKAGGTKEAFIVSFVDEWQDKISWVNPEKLFIEENIDFNDKDIETKKQLIRLVAINKIEEFAILTNRIIEPQIKEELEKLSFIQRFPKGIYQFKYLENQNGEIIDKNCEILVYDNIEQSYKNLLYTLPAFFEDHNLSQREKLTENELNNFAQRFENEFFQGVDKYPAYSIQDIKNLLQYYTVQDEIPQYIELNEREKYDIDKIAHDIYIKDLGPKALKDFIDEIWKNNELGWKTFFNYDIRHFIREIDLAITKITRPALYAKKTIKPEIEYESRDLELMPLYEIRKTNPSYGKWLTDQVFDKYTDNDGYYFSSKSGIKSKNRLRFQIDHIIPLSKGGLTTLDNLQVLTVEENKAKGNKY